LTDRRSLSSDEATALLRVVRDYAFALDVLDAYDRGQVPHPRGEPQAATPISLDEARKMIAAMRTHYGGSTLFGQEQGDRLAGALSAIFQTAAGREVYPTVEEKAAQLLYFLVKDHPFVDGNKRIGAVLFLRFLEKNGLLYRPDGTTRLSQEALVALTLLIAESRPHEKKLLVHLIVFLLQGRLEDVEVNS